MEITVRDYRESDYAVCRQLWAELVVHHAEIYDNPEFGKNDSGRGIDEYLARPDRAATWVAEENGRVIGVAGLIATVGNEGHAEIDPVVVMKGRRNGGIGSRLVDHAVGEAKRRGFKYVGIKPQLRNEAAFRLYARLGFDKVGAVDLFRDLQPDPGRKWKAGVEILGRTLRY